MYPARHVAGILDGHQKLLEWGWFQVTVANLIVIVLMVAVFALAVFAPFPKGKR